MFLGSLMKSIEINGARIHNLKNIDICIPKEELVVVTGVSGSGKSSLVFDIIFEEGKKQYLQSIGMIPGIAAVSVGRRYETTKPNRA